MSHTSHFGVDVRFYRLSPAIEPYFTALYAFDFDCPPDAIIEDYLHPEWTAMRFCDGPSPLAAIGLGPLEPTTPFVATGPTSCSIHFGLSRGRIWGLGLQPFGWARFAKGMARDLTDRIVDGMANPALAPFRPILEIVRQADVPAGEIAAQIDACLLSLAGRPGRAEERVLACQNALRDPTVANVAELGERLGLGARALERLCARYFGFPPKHLLRRQRFLRSLASFMLETDRSNWSTAIDGQYYDQAQFVKDFRAFMGMTPSEYAEMPHPVLERIMAQRMADQGAAPQPGLVEDLPTILRYAGATAR
ncbi:helix-turn-helix domain-containing protein [Tsuneonella sp. HG222]